jgi:hypothetical protein
MALSYYRTSTINGFFLSASFLKISLILSISVGGFIPYSFSLFLMNFSLMVTYSVWGVADVAFDLCSSYSGLRSASSSIRSSSASFFYRSICLALVPIFLEASEMRSLATLAASCLLSLNMSKPNSISWFLDFPVGGGTPGRCGGLPILCLDRADGLKDELFCVT